MSSTVIRPRSISRAPRNSHGRDKPRSANLCGAEGWGRRAAGPAVRDAATRRFHPNAPRSSKENEDMLCSIIADGKLHIFQVTATGDLVHGSHAAGTGAFPF